MVWITIAILGISLSSCKDDKKIAPPSDTKGTAGSLSWELSEDGTLAISGIGAIPDYALNGSGSTVTSPWYAHRTATKTLELGNAVTHIGSHSFAYFFNLENIISTSLTDSTTIGNDSNDNDYTFFNIPESITSIGDRAFTGCIGLKGKITIPSHVTHVGEWAFFNCNGITNVIIQDGVIEVAHRLFSNCAALQTITIPSTVRTVREWSLAGCSALDEITVKAIEPPAVWSYAFNGVKRNVTIYVPQESLSAYKNSEHWKEFTNIQGKVF